MRRGYTPSRQFESASGVLSLNYSWQYVYDPDTKTGGSQNYYFGPLFANFVENGLTISPSSQSGAIELNEDAHRDILNSPATGQIGFTDIITSQRPTATLGKQTVVITNALGQKITSSFTAAQIALLKAAFNFQAADGNTNNGTIDWTYNPKAIGKNFLKFGGTAVVTSVVNISDGNGDNESATVTETLKGTNPDPLKLYFDASISRSFLGLAELHSGFSIDFSDAFGRLSL